MKLTRTQLVKWLFKLGWTAYTTYQEAKEATDQEIEQYTRNYQEFWGLTVDGVVGPITTRSITDRFCACPDQYGQGLQRWNPDFACKEGIAWTIMESIPGMSATDYRDAFELGLSYWSEVCGVKWRYVTDPNDANLLAYARKMDGPSGTLAESQLAGVDFPKNRSLWQRYDNAEPWKVAENPRGGEIDIVRVVSHESGHLLGMGHGGNGLMAPMYSRQIRKPQPGYDIDSAVARYGKPAIVVPTVPTVPVTPTPPTPTAGNSVVKVYGADFSAEFRGQNIVVDRS